MGMAFPAMTCPITSPPTSGTYFCGSAEINLGGGGGTTIVSGGESSGTTIYEDGSTTVVTGSSTSSSAMLRPILAIGVISFGIFAFIF